jgi:flagellar assembly protein FliH
VIRRVPHGEVLGRAQPLEGPSARSLTPSGGEPAEPSASEHTALARALTLLLSEELRISPEHIRQVLARELLRVRRAKQVLVRVHPNDLALLAAPDDYIRELELAGKLAFCADPTLTPGGCVLTSNLGEVDAQVETRLSLALTLLRHIGAQERARDFA